jgi:hypothetical protein
MGSQVEMWCQAPGMKRRVGLVVGGMVGLVLLGWCGLVRVWIGLS